MKNINEKYTGAFKSGEGLAGYRYVSGRQVLDEVFVDGRIVSRYRNCTGQVYPEMHFSVDGIKAAISKYSDSDSFSLSISGKSLNGGWKLNGFEKRENTSEKFNTYALKLDHDTGISVNVCTGLTGTDYLVRWLEITNTSESTVAVTGVCPFAGQIFRHGRNISSSEVFEHKSEYEIAYNHASNWGEEGDFFFDSLNIGDFSYCCDHGKSGWSRPAAWLRDNFNSETFVCEFAWSGNWHFRTHVRSDSELSGLCFEIGMLEIDGEALRVIEPGETISTPQVHFALFHDSDDAIVQKTHEYVRDFILPPLPDYVPVSEIEANHRGYLCDRESEEGIKADIDVAAEIGAEMYVVDAGWYGTREPNQWWNNTGDWVGGPWMKNGFEPIPEYAHKKGMRFGLWVEIEAMGGNSKLRDEHPEWSAVRHGEKCADGRALDLANPEVEAFCYNTICRLIEQYSLDMYRIDHNHNIGLGATREFCGFCENTLWRYYEAFYRIFDKVRQKYPQLVLQNCAGGGGRLDWGTMSRFHNCETSDWLRQPRGTRILSGLTMSLPPEIMLKTFGTESGEWKMDGDIDAQLRICMISRPIYRGIAPSLAELTPYLKEKIIRNNQLYKNFFRPLMENCLVYHHTPFQPVHKSAPLTVLEYISPTKDKGMIAVFTQSPGDYNDIIIKSRGVSREKTYKVTFDNSGESIIISGNELISSGLCVAVGCYMSSELVMISEIV
jgi:Alpha-galactosidase